MKRHKSVEENHEDSIMSNTVNRVGRKELVIIQSIRKTSKTEGNNKKI